MFSAAYAIAKEYTFPVVASYRRWSGRVETGAGAFIVLNADGWILTVAHLFDIAAQSSQDQPKVAALRAKITALEADPSLQPGYRARQVRQLQGQANRDWITNVSYWWSRDGIVLQDLTVIGEADLAIGRLDPYPSDMTSIYPVFKDPGLNFARGTSLCRLGFPFTDLNATYDQARDAFSIESGQLVFFPIEGIFTRLLDASRSSDGKHPLLFVETSSPGLRGQSGGPVFDVQGRVWALQNRTQHIPLGFNPTIKVRGRETVEHQFINLGVGVHAETIISVLQDLRIAHQVSPD